jgi:hypothetical protein
MNTNIRTHLNYPCRLVVEPAVVDGWNHLVVYCQTDDLYLDELAGDDLVMALTVIKTPTTVGEAVAMLLREAEDVEWTVEADGRTQAGLTSAEDEMMDRDLTGGDGA